VGDTVTFFGERFPVDTPMTVIVPSVGLHSVHRYISFSRSNKIASACLHIHFGRGTRFRPGLATIPCNGLTVISIILFHVKYHSLKKYSSS